MRKRLIFKIGIIRQKCGSVLNRIYGFVIKHFFFDQCGRGFSPGFPLKVFGGGNIKVGNNFRSMANCCLLSNDGEIIIGDNLSLNTNVQIGASGGKIYIGNNVLIGPNSVLRSADHGISRNRMIQKQPHVSGTIKIEDDVWIGSNVVILKNVNLGKGCVVAAGAVVTKNVEQYTIVGGIPAVKISERYPKLIFWDFDGVIKDSVDVKTQAFGKLFEAYGTSMAERVKAHHVANGGMSRFKKLPLYLSWAGVEPVQDRVDECCKKFSEIAFQGVINAPWVPGAENYLRINPNDQIFILVSATPEEELGLILEELSLKNCFSKVFGSPTSKIDAISMTLNNLCIKPEQCLMIGDALADLEAAQTNQVPFLLRRHESNGKVFADYKGNSIKDLTEL